jgi:hypothetical protein
MMNPDLFAIGVACAIALAGCSGGKQEKECYEATHAMTDAWEKFKSEQSDVRSDTYWAAKRWRDKVCPAKDK